MSEAIAAAQPSGPAVGPVLRRVEGRLGHLTLNRPGRINALDLDTIEAVSAALSDWAADPDVELVLIDGAGERGLCAGGDLRALHQAISGHDQPAAVFFAREYEMNSTIGHFPKPVVSFMDGIVFGGGVGIAAHARFRVVTQRSQVAMPETAIGLYPDVGALHLLARAPGEFGTHAALTGARLDARQAIYAGLADVEVDVAHLPALVESLRTGALPDVAALGGTSTPMTEHPGWIDASYRFDTVTEIFAALSARPEPEAAQALAALHGMSPTSLAVTLTGIRQARTLTLDEVLEQDMRVCARFLAHPDLREGIRAQIIDKDRRPRWNPAGIDDVDPAEVAGFFAPLS